MRKNEKLKSKELFKSLFQEGKSIRSHPLKLIYIKADFPDDVAIKVGFVAPKKQFGKAVDRNRLKRLMREAYRANKPLVFNNMEGKFAFLFLYLGNQMHSYEEVSSSMEKLLGMFINRMNDEKN